jgi:hypothetical protein
MTAMLAKSGLTSPLADTISRTERSEFLKANPYLMGLCDESLITIPEGNRRALVADALKEYWGSTPFYARKAENDPDYWSKVAGVVGNLLVGAVWRGQTIPNVEQTFPL